MPVSNDFLSYVLDKLAGWEEVYTKRMFGGVALYADGLVFALIARDVVHLKVDETNIENFKKEGSKPLKPFKNDAIVPSFYELPPDVFEDSDEFIKWANESLEIQKKLNKNKK